MLDWGGVLTTPMDDSFRTWMSLEAVDPASFQACMRALHDEPGSALHRVERGEIDRAEFETALAAGLRTLDGGTVPGDGLLARMMAHLAPNEPVRALVRDARVRGWATVVLSNSWGNDYDLDDLDGLVDTVLLSDRIGERKPDAAAYLRAAGAAGAEPARCVFVDDLRRNVRGAEATGMRALHYRPGAEAQLRALIDA